MRENEKDWIHGDDGYNVDIYIYIYILDVLPFRAWLGDSSSKRERRRLGAPAVLPDSLGLKRASTITKVAKPALRCDRASRVASQDVNKYRIAYRLKLYTNFFSNWTSFLRKSVAKIKVVLAVN